MKPIFLLLAIFCICLHCYSQRQFNDLALKIDRDLETYSDKFPKETISLLSDKQEYFAGDNVLLSFFVNINGKPGDLSRTLYVELGDYDGKIIDKKMLAIEKGAAQTIFSIPLTLPSGMYVINAYTLWMKNTPQLIVQKQILVINSDYVSKPFLLKDNETPVAKALFMPEGNSWADGVEQTFNLQLLNNRNVPLARTFSILENGKEIKTGTTDVNGLSKLSLTLKKGNAYQLASGSQQLNLAIENEGVSMSFNTANKTRLFVNLQKSATSKSNKFLLIAVDEEKLCYQSVFDFAEGAMGAAITKSKLPSGLLNFLLFDEDQNIVAQRYYYNYIESAPISQQVIESNLVIRTDTSVKNPFLSVVIPSKQSLFETQNNLVSLFPQLQNQSAVQIPDLSPTALQTVDQLYSLISSGLVGQKWKLDEMSLKYPLESGITLRGFIKPYAGSANPKGYKAVLVVKGEDSTTTYSTVQTEANGDFAIGDLKFQKAAKIFFQGNNTANQREILNSQLYPSYIDTLRHLTAMPFVQYEKHFTNTPQTAELQKHYSDFVSDSRYKALETVVIKTKTRSPIDSLKQVYLTPLYTDGNSIILQPDGHFINFWHFLRGKVPGLRVDGNIDNPDVYFSRYGGNFNPANNTGEDLGQSFDETGIMFFLNEVPVSKDIVGTLNPNDVALVVANREPMATLGAYNGMIAIYTKKGVPMGSATTKSMTYEKRTGYSNMNSVYKMDNDLLKEGTPVYFGPTKKNLLVPSKFTYNTVLAGWNSKGEFVFYTK